MAKAISEQVWKRLALWAIRRLRRQLEYRTEKRFDSVVSLELDRLVVAEEALKL